MEDRELHRPCWKSCDSGFVDRRSMLIGNLTVPIVCETANEVN